MSFFKMQKAAFVAKCKEMEGKCQFFLNIFVVVPLPVS